MTGPKRPGRTRRKAGAGMLHILVIEDDAEHRELIRDSLNAPGREAIKLSFASTLEEAERLIDANKYSCVLVDHRLPDGYGIELVERLEPALLTTPVIGLSSEFHLELALAYFRAGCAEFLPKDDAYGPDVLRRHVVEATAKFQRRAMLAILERKALETAVTESQEGLIGLARTDRLLGIYNRATFDDVRLSFHNDVSGRKGCYAFCMVDVDRFKAYNDHHGHAAGDKALHMVAAALKGTLRGNDFIARYGGEEIVILLDGVNAQTSESVAGRLRHMVERLEHPHEGNPPHGVITVSIGVALFGPDHPGTPDSILQAADDAMYRAKRAGRNQVVIASTPREEAA